MSSTWLPGKDTVLQAWATNFSTKISATPLVYGLLAADGTLLATNTGNFTTALGLALNPVTRTKSTVAAKDSYRAVLVAQIRALAKRVQAYPTVTNAQRTDLGLPIKNAPTPIPAPGAAPLVNLVGTGIRIHLLRLADAAAPSKRGRPAGVQGAEVFSFVPDATTPTPPASLEQWRFEGLTTKQDCTVAYEEADVGKTATIVARWYNPKGEPGPTSTPITKMIAA